MTAAELGRELGEAICAPLQDVVKAMDAMSDALTHLMLAMNGMCDPTWKYVETPEDCGKNWNTILAHLRATRYSLAAYIEHTARAKAGIEGLDRWREALAQKGLRP